MRQADPRLLQASLQEALPSRVHQVRDLAVWFSERSILVASLARRIYLTMEEI